MIVPRRPNLPLLLCAFGWHAPVWIAERRIYPPGNIGMARCRRCDRPLGH